MKTSAIVSLAIAGSCLACSEEPSALLTDHRATPHDAGAPRDGETRHDDGSTASSDTAPPGDEARPSDAGEWSTSGLDTNDKPLELDTELTDAGARTFPRPLGAVPTSAAGEPNAPSSSRDAETAEPDAEDARRAPLGTRDFACQPSKSPMFQSQELLRMTISGDFTRVNNEPAREDAVSPGLLDPDGLGPLDAVPVEIRARGHLRYLECGYRPFKVVFEEKQKDNVFRKLGKSVKFSTHCGDREDMDPVLQAPSLEEYYQRVRMEHAAYQIVDALETLSLETRLVELTYHDTATDTEETHLAFVREPEDEMADRCDMVEGEDIPSEPPAGTNYRAELLLFLVNNFILQADVKNKLELRDLERGESVLAPYDFDLVGIFRRDFFKLKGRTLQENNAAFGDWLRRNQSPELFEEVALVLSRRESMRAVIDEAGLNSANKALFDEWFGLFIDTLGVFVGCQEPNDANRAACYVPDDYPDAINEAPLVELGENKLWLEPPGDKDVIGVALQGNNVYSFVTRTPARIRGPEGQLLESVPAVEWGAVGSSYSFGTTTAATYRVEFDHGASLVCSDMWANDLNAQYHAWALYADDHGNTPELATPLTAGATTEGTWELDTLQNVFDEDWFRLDVSDTTKLTLHFHGSGAGNIDSFKLDALDQVVGYVELFPPVAETTDLAEVFPEPGSYLIRVIQNFGDGTYSLEVD